MTVRYVGPGGDDAQSGLSWANRKLTLTGVEDTPVQAGDVVYIGPGTYRETLTLDVNGADGSPITYIGDVDGSHTNGIGGAVRVTASDDDQTLARASCVVTGTRSYRTFRGISFEYGTASVITGDFSNFIIEDCFVASGNTYGIVVTGANQAANTIRRCIVVSRGGASSASGIYFTHSSTLNNTGHLVQNCLILGGGYGVAIARIGGITVSNCTIFGGQRGVIVAIALAAGQTVTVNYSSFYAVAVAVQATATAEFVENYNNFFSNGTDRTTVTAGANSTAYPPNWVEPLLLAGFRFPWMVGELNELSALRGLAAGTPSAEDLYGMSRPATNTKKSWGAIQYSDISRSTAQIRGVTGASLCLADAGRLQMIVPVTNVSTTFSVYVYRGANYAGTAPQMVVKQSGQADVTVTDAGAAGGWNELTTTLTPAASPAWVIVELVSNNTAAAGSYAVYFDDLAVA